MADDDELPIEVQLPWSPHSGSLESHPQTTGGGQRWRFGEVFTGRQVGKLNSLVGPDL